MRVVRRPPRYTGLVMLLLLAPPVFLLNLWVMQKGSLPKLLSQDSLTLLGAQSAWVLVSVYWLLKARWRGFFSVALLGAVLVGGNLYFLIISKNYALAFYALFLLIMMGLYCFHLYRALGESFYHSGQDWFEGRPVFLPGIEAEVITAEKAVPVRLSKLGVEGCFAYQALSPRASFARTGRMSLKLGDLSVECGVELVTESKDGAGHGFRFVDAGADQQKDIRDFIDRVRSAGYVS